MPSLDYVIACIGCDIDRVEKAGDHWWFSRAESSNLSGHTVRVGPLSWGFGHASA